LKLWDAHNLLAEQIKTAEVGGNAQLSVLDESLTKFYSYDKKVIKHHGRKTTPFTWGEAQKISILRNLR
jgi:hypothetical protein